MKGFPACRNETEVRLKRMKRANRKQADKMQERGYELSFGAGLWLAAGHPLGQPLGGHSKCSSRQVLAALLTRPRS